MTLSGSANIAYHSSNSLAKVIIKNETTKFSNSQISGIKKISFLIKNSSKYGI
nr:MAG TPA: hypothetical protein [Caudoviricetes sp.]